MLTLVPKTYTMDSRWMRLCEHISPYIVERAHELYRILGEHYSGSRRFYHTMGHIAYCLKTLDMYRHLADNPFAVEYALFFHDVIYRTGKRPKGLPSNEELSAECADSILGPAGVHMSFRVQVVGLVLATSHDLHELNTRDEKLIADIDWSPLGCPWKEFEQNGRHIRREYPSDDEAFRDGREAFLRMALQRERQFHLPEFEAAYGERAVSNLKKAYRDLTGREYR